MIEKYTNCSTRTGQMKLRRLLFLPPASNIDFRRKYPLLNSCDRIVAGGSVCCNTSRLESSSSSASLGQTKVNI